MRTAQAWIDGSYNPKKKIYGFGGYMDISGQPRINIKGYGDDPRFVCMRNVAGEIQGAMTTLDIAERNKVDKIKIFYDYYGIEKWAIGEWKANKVLTKAYQRQVKRLTEQGMTIEFEKVLAHSGDEGNEKADRMAKEACGL